jgi:hypothetical protein
MKIFKKITLSVVTAGLLLSSGCAIMDSAKEAIVASMEKPSIEKSLNRIKLGINIIRTNSDILYNLPISEDANWPEKVARDINETLTKYFQEKYLDQDPFYGTVKITDAQAGNLYSLSPLTLRFYNRVDVLYSKKPNIDELPLFDLKKYREFSDAKLIKVEAKRGKLYPNVEKAVLSLVPESRKDELEVSNNELNLANRDVLFKKAEIGELEMFLEINKGSQSAPEKMRELEVAEFELKQLEEIASQKKDIYFQLIDNSVEILRTDISLNENLYKLAKKLSLALENVSSGSLQAGTLFTISLVRIDQDLKSYDAEMANLMKAQLRFAQNITAKGKKISELLNIRAGSIKDNAMYALPYLGVGSYFAVQQQLLASKYKDIVNIVIEAYEKKKG